MTDINLEYPPEEFARRDAIHVAILPVIAGEKLQRGQKVAVRGRLATATTINSLGIVNPFDHRKEIETGDLVWVFLHPGTVSSIRHHWTHPSVDADDSSSESEMWLRHFADRAGIGYEEMLACVERWLGGGEPWVQLGSERARGMYWEATPEFWEHYRTVTKTNPTMPDDVISGPFSCSC